MKPRACLSLPRMMEGPNNDGASTRAKGATILTCELASCLLPCNDLHGSTYQPRTAKGGRPRPWKISVEQDDVDRIETAVAVKNVPGVLSASTVSL
jgi:hypothetical protein